MKLEDIPTYEISQESFVLIQRIEELLVQTRRITDRKVTLRLRKASMIRSINSSLAIEGNDMDLLNVRDIVNGKIVEGPFDEVLEVKNAIEAYRMAKTVDPWSIDDFLKVFDALMFGLIQSEGFRTFGVGVFEGDRLLYRAPDAEDVVPMMERLFTWGRTSNTHPAIKAAVVHFFIEAIHPFEDGNGRMGRLWQNVVLERYDRSFSMVPVESRIGSRQEEYYQVLQRCHELDPQDCTEFIEFSLSAILESLDGLAHITDAKMDRLLSALGDRTMSAVELMSAMGLKDRKNLQDAYIRPAIGYGFLERVGSANSPHVKYRGIL